MGVRLVAVALAAALVAAAGAARADDAAGPGSQPWLAALQRPGAAWVLQVPLRLSMQAPVPTPALLRTDLTLHRPFDLEDYPDPRRAAIRTFRLELEGDQNFGVFDVPMNARFVEYKPAIAPQLGPSVVEPLWAGDATVRLPHELYGGAALWQRVDGQKALFVVAGRKF